MDEEEAVKLLGKLIPTIPINNELLNDRSPELIAFAMAISKASFVDEEKGQTVESQAAVIWQFCQLLFMYGVTSAPTV